MGTLTREIARQPTCGRAFSTIYEVMLVDVA
jgi:hypothetical protein